MSIIKEKRSTPGMGVTMATDGSQIFLRWDLKFPPYVDAKVVKRPEDILFYWDHIREFCKWVEYKRCFVLTFSKQNLQRIHAQFGQIQCTHGYHHIQELKAGNESFAKMVERAKKIIEMPFDQLPKYDYKAPPLAEYQHRANIYLCNVYAAPIFADCGCLAGDTEIKINRGGCSRKYKISDLYKSFKTSFDRSIPTKVRSFKGDRIGLHEIVDVIESGIKTVYLLKLECGFEIKATGDHKIMTSVGWVELLKLTPDHNVMIDVLTKHKTKTTKAMPKKLNDKRLAVGGFHPYARKQMSHQGKSFSYLLEDHRLCYEAGVNGLTKKELIARTYSGDISGLDFIDPNIYVIHHKDGDHYNNDFENLEKMTHEDHAKIHSKGYENFGHGEPEYSRVASVEMLSEEMTYDISCDDPHHNFVANGIVVHNCGKTWMVLNSTERQIKLGVLKRGKTLVAVKLPTIETGWLDDCRKFTDLKIQNLWFPSSKKKDDKFMEALHSGADLFVLNHDTARIYQQELVEYGFDKVVIDESTILKGFHSEHPNAKGGQFGKAILSIAQRAKYRVILSGTPAPNSPEDLWGQFKFLDPNGYSLFERSFYDYRNEFMDVVDIRPQNKRFREVEGGQKIFVPLGPKDPKKYKPKKDTPQRIYDFLGRYAFRVRLRDVIKDFPEKTVVQRMIHISPELRAHYDKMEDELQVIINDERIVASIKLTQMQKLRQLTGGFIIDHKEEVHPVEENNKLEELDSILDDEISHDDKVVIYAQYRHEIEAIEKRYKKYGIVSVYGGNTTKQNLDNIRKFKEDPKIRLIVLHPKSAAHGITFTCAHYMIFYSYDHSAEDAYQCKSRIERAGQKHNMIIFYLSCYKTVDEDTYKAVLLKIHNQSYLIDGTAPTEEDQESINKLLLNQFKERRKNAVDRPA